MNATKRSVARAGLVVCSVLTVALTGCRTHVVHEHRRTVYVPAPPPPTPVVIAAPQAQEPMREAPAPVVVMTPPELPPVVVIQSEHDFYEPLAAHGRWVVVGAYGRCWIPSRVEAGWRPYSNGYWQRTDAGWYWASEEPWGWATYHYGRWDFHAPFGWIWVPQTQWAPAWVAWREGGGYVGWAPLRPSVTIGVNIHVADYEPAFASRAFVFVEHRRMLEPVRPKTVIVNNTTVINQTVNITNVKVVNKTVINEGPRPDVIERESGRKVKAVPVREFRHREETTVIARHQGIPTAPASKGQPSARTEPRPAEKKGIPPPAGHRVEKPAIAMTQPPQPTATAARPTPPRPEVGKTARDETKSQTETWREVTATPPVVRREAKREVESEHLTPPRREVRPVGRPTVAAKPTPQPVTTSPIPVEKERKSAIEKKNIVIPPAGGPKSTHEVRREPKHETRPPGKVEARPLSTVKKQTALSAEKPVEKQVITAQEKSRASTPAEANKKMQEDKSPRRKGEAQETPRTVPARPPQ